MKWWRQWTRKRDGWIERKRRFQKMFAGKIQKRADAEVPDAAGVTDSDTDVGVANRGEG